jgi:hypothetical protein
MTIEAAAPSAATPQRPVLAEGVAFIDGAFVPIADAKISILDWSFLKSDVARQVAAGPGDALCPLLQAER